MPEVLFKWGIVDQQYCIHTLLLAILICYERLVSVYVCMQVSLLYGKVAEKIHARQGNLRAISRIPSC